MRVLEPAEQPALPTLPSLSTQGWGPFVGRADELAAVQAASGPVVLVGPGGIGKTRLAREVVHGRRAAWVDLDVARTEVGVQSALASALGIGASSDAEAMAGAFRAARGDEIEVVVLDTLEPLDAEAMAWLGRFVEAAGGGVSWVATSRVVPPWAGWTTVRLGPLAPAEAAELYRRCCPVASPSDEERIDTLAHALEGLPLAIDLAARSRLGRRRTEGGGPARHRSLEACLDASWSLLDVAHQDALVALTVFEGGIDPLAAQAVVRPTGAVEEVLQALVDASLLEAGPSGRYRLLDLVRRFVRRRADPEALARASRRHGDWFAQAAHDGRAVELHNYVVAARRADRRDVAAQCALGAWAVLDAQGPVELGLDLLEPLYRSARGDLRAELGLALSAALAARGQLDASLALLREERARLGEAHPLSVRCLRYEGTRLFELGRMPEAHGVLEEAAARAEAVGDRSAQAEVEGMLGLTLQRLGRLSDSVPHHERAIALHDAEGRAVRKAACLGNLGALRFEQGHPDLALPLFEEAVRLHRAHGNARLEAVVLVSLGLLVARRGELERAAKVLRRCQRLAKQVGSVRLEAYALVNLAVVQHVQVEEGVEATLRRTLNRAQRCGDTRVEAHAERTWGQWALDAGRLGEARTHLQRALTLTEEGVADGLHELVLGLLAWLEVADGQVARAALLLAVAEQGQQAGDLPQEVAAIVGLARAVERGAAGDAAGAKAAMASARARLEAMGCQPGSPLDHTARQAAARLRS